MKKETIAKLVIILILTVLLIVMCVIYFNGTNKKNTFMEQIGASNFIQNATETQSSSEDSQTQISTTAEIESALVENVSLHSAYYLSEVLVEENQEVEAGTNILKYTNGTYFTAPYDCIISKINVPETGKQITNEHYIEVSSINLLAVNLSVDETKIDGISIGQDAEIEVNAVSKTYSGNVTNISNTAQNGKFTVTVEFENDSNVKLGMTANVEI